MYWFAFALSLLTASWDTLTVRGVVSSALGVQAWFRDELISRESANEVLNPPAWIFGALLFCVGLFPALQEIIASAIQPAYALALLPLPWILSFWQAYFHWQGLSGPIRYLGFVPFAVPLPAFLFGVLLGMAASTSTHGHSLPRSTLLGLRLTLSAMLLVALVWPLSWSHRVPLFFRWWIATGALCPLFGAWTWTVVGLWNETNEDLLDRFLRHPVCQALGDISYVFLLIHTPVLRMLWRTRYTLCDHVLGIAICSSSILLEKTLTSTLYFSITLGASFSIHHLFERQARRRIIFPLLTVREHIATWWGRVESFGILRSRNVIFYVSFVCYMVLAYRVSIYSLPTGSGNQRSLPLPLISLEILMFLSYIILAAMLLINLVGHVVFPPFSDSPQHSSDAQIKSPVCVFFRYVTKGMNSSLIAKNVTLIYHEIRKVLDHGQFFIEVITDKEMRLCDLVDVEVCERIVPASYQCPNGAKFKARALQYAVEESFATDQDWIVHLDEETLFDCETVTAIVLHISQELGSPTPAIGQGPVVYFNRRLRNNYRNWLTTLGDSYRVADDFGKFRIQYFLGRPFLGMHGSYVVCQNAIERKLGFDHGMAGSITEDAYFALLAYSKGVPFRWINSCMFEQSPFSFSDVIRQRSRWLAGLILVCLSSKIPFRYRAILCVATTGWLCLPLNFLGMPLLAMSSASLLSSRVFTLFFAGLCGAISWCYLYGFLRSFSPRDGLGLYATLMYLQVALQPLFGLIETISVGYTITQWTRVTSGFHVVEKSSED